MNGYTCARNAIAILATVLPACGGNSTSPSIPVGAEGGACTTGGGCDPGLVCVSRICASSRDSGSSPPNGCNSSVLGGIGIPAGTVATANASYTPYTPDKAIDGELGRGWNAGSNTGWLRLDFPTAIAITGVRLAAFASPSSDETFVISENGQGTTIGDATRRVAAGTSAAQLAPIPVTPGTYSSITIAVKAAASWVEVSEVSLLTSDCSVQCGCDTRMCGDDGCGTNCGTCESGETCNAAGECVS